MKHRIVTAAQMKAIEQAGNAHGLPYLQMMENAGLAVYAELKKALPQPSTLLVVCGKQRRGRFCHRPRRCKRGLEGNRPSGRRRAENARCHHKF